MKMNAVLTVGWHDDPGHPFAAAKLDAAAGAEPDYASALGRELDVGGRLPPSIYGLERLFRRRPGGFEALRRFVGALVQMPEPRPGVDPLQCEIDVFAYVFLSRARNLDFLLPEEALPTGSFRQVGPRWRLGIRALEEFERAGKPLPPQMGVSAQDYLGLRRIVTRASACHERCCLASLLISGPSTLAQLLEDLRLTETRAQRIIGNFLGLGVVEHRQDGSIAVTEHLMPLVIFFLREKFGLDLMGNWRRQAP